MKAGVSKEPWGVVMTPRRAEEAGSRATRREGTGLDNGGGISITSNHWVDAGRSSSLLITGDRRSARTDEFFQGQTDVEGNPSEEWGRDVPSLVKGHRRTASISVSELLVRTPLPNLD